MSTHDYIKSLADNTDALSTWAKPLVPIIAKMRSIPYGGCYNIKEDRFISEKELRSTGARYGNDECRVMSPEEVFKYKECICWDASLVGYDALKKLKLNGLKIQLCFLFSHHGNNQVQTHTFIVCEYNSRVYSLELRWTSFFGLSEAYASLDDMLQPRLQKFVEPGWKLAEVNYVSDERLAKFLSNIKHTNYSDWITMCSNKLR